MSSFYLAITTHLLINSNPLIPDLNHSITLRLSSERKILSKFSSQKYHMIVIVKIIVRLSHESLDWRPELLWSRVFWKALKRNTYLIPISLTIMAIEITTDSPTTSTASMILHTSKNLGNKDKDLIEYKMTSCTILDWKEDSKLVLSIETITLHLPNMKTPILSDMLENLQIKEFSTIQLLPSTIQKMSLKPVEWVLLLFMIHLAETRALKNHR